MELRHLIYFEAVARHQHISKAAAELLIAQPALTKQIRDLEQELGVKLLERVGRNIRLTEAGQRWHVHVLTILTVLNAARAEMRERAGIERGRVAVGTPPTVGLRLLPDLLAEFHRQHPTIELHVRENSSQQLLRLLDEGEIDFAIVTLPTVRRDLEEIVLFEEPLVIVVAQNHALAGRKSIDIAELAEEPFLLYPPGYEMREATITACKRAGFTPRIALDGGEIHMLLCLAEVGLGLALMPPLALSGNERLVQLSIRDQDLRRTVGLVSRRDRALIPAAETMRNFLAQRLQTLTQTIP
jgi:DNA-binding transcriptional LysR family regulator